ncbi:MAG: ThiF family adenylyltransferase [Pirellulales bacterium]|nr:ThiF family adenylyltransferase [Pseudobdellovibrionaceae bacterium]MBX3433659.1 ThiF family adenylyltransferase [Pirellulales bacterium]MBX3435474.1 ThiF family adenylyltransferase [Pirellulales bacterium]
MSSLPKDDRFARQRDLVPPERLAPRAVSVIGCGAIGRPVALQLAALGVRRLQLVDFDRVAATNVTTQGYRAADVGRLKVDALAADLRALEPALELDLVPERWRPRIPLGDVVFACVDAIATRAALWRGGGDVVPSWFDGRMRGETVRILAAYDGPTRAHYATTLFPPAEAQRGACTSRSTIYAASVAAGLLVGQFVKRLRGLPVAPDLVLNLLADELAPLDAGRPSA